MIKRLYLYLFVASTIAPHVCFGAPIPATSSSLIVSEKPGLFRSPKGFKVHAGDTGWKQIQRPVDNPFVATVYRSPDLREGVQPALTVRIDSLKQTQSLDDYTKAWIKDYPRLGFDILAAKKVKVGQEIGFLLDLINRDNDMQLRQILFVKNKDVVNMTCRDLQRSFNQTLKSCNEIFRTFSW